MNNRKWDLHRLAAWMTAFSVLMWVVVRVPLAVYAAPNISEAPSEAEGYFLDEHWEYTENEDGTITLNSYIGEETDLIVYGSYWIGEEKYTTRLPDDCSDMFNPLIHSTLPDLSTIKFDTGIQTDNVTNMNAMFANLISLEELDVRGFDTSNVEYMANMFDGLNNLKNLDLSNFNTGKVTTMAKMFQNNKSLTELNLSSFDTRAINAANDPEALKWMFANCEKMEQIIIGENWQISDFLETESKMFTGEDGFEHKPCTIQKNQLTDKRNLPILENMAAFYNAAEGRWQKTSDGIAGYGKCKDHKGGILGVIITTDKDLQYYWINTDKVSPIHR